MRLQSRLGNWEIIKPGRYIVKEGELDKVSRKTLQPRYFILVLGLVEYFIHFCLKTSSLYFSVERLLVVHELPEFTISHLRSEAASRTAAQPDGIATSAGLCFHTKRKRWRV